jgi:sulfur carrier protein
MNGGRDRGHLARRSQLQLAAAGAYDHVMKVHLSHPERQVEVKGPRRVKELLRDLNLVPEAHLVIRGDELVTEDELLKDQDSVEVRPVISGGS